MPFGALVIYKATKRQQVKRMKFDPTGVYGISWASTFTPATPTPRTTS